MRIQNKIIAKLKNLLSRHNEIDAAAEIHPSAQIKGSKIGQQAKIGSGVLVEDSTIFRKAVIGGKTTLTNTFISGEITCGENCRLYHCHLQGKVSIGRYTSLWGPNLDVTATEEFTVSIGSFCSIARNVSIQPFNHNYKKASTYFIGQNFFKEKWANERVSKGNVTIMNDVWIGAHSVILEGVTIGNGAIIAANCVVRTDVPPYAIVGGVPGKVVGYRFEQDIIDKLQNLSWWEWDDDKIQNNKPFFEQPITVESFDNIVN